jgi:hypothetical protein
MITDGYCGVFFVGFSCVFGHDVKNSIELGSLGTRVSVLFISTHHRGRHITLGETCVFWFRHLKGKRI